MGNKEVLNMEQFIGTKIIEATPMNLGDYNRHRGWEIPADEDPTKEGYLVKYTDGYLSWSPKQVFDEAYRRTNNMNFGLALEVLKKGQKVARKGWNGKGIFIYYVPANKYPAGGNTLGTMNGVFKDDMVFYGAYIAICTTGLITDNEYAPKSVVPWLASQTDMLSDDWMIV